MIDDKNSVQSDAKSQQLNIQDDNALPMNKSKNAWVRPTLLTAVIALGLFFMFKLANSIGIEAKSFREVMSNVNSRYLLFTLCAFVAIIVFDFLKYVIITHATTGECRLKTSGKVTFLGRYYDAITPFGTGGQPMQIVYLTKRGYTVGESSAVILVKYFVNNYAWVLFCLLFMIFNKNALLTYVTEPSQQKLFLVAGWIGWAINALLPSALVVLSFFPNATEKVLNFFVNLWFNVCSLFAKKEKGKQAIQSKREKSLAKTQGIVDDFDTGCAMFLKKPFHCTLAFIVCLAENACTYSLPYFVVMTYASDSVTASFALLVAVITLNVYAHQSVSVVPTPGNSGVLESAVLIVFSSIAQSVIAWTVITWRFLTYYVFILIGVFLYLYELARHAWRKKHRLN